MKINATVKTPAETNPEVGFIHDNGSVILKSSKGCLVIGGFWGSYEASQAQYDYWKEQSHRILTSKDSVELTFQ